MNIVDRVIKNIKKKNLIVKGDRLILGCSGGPDSIFLLDVLLKLREELNLTLTLVHINHMFRGKEADRDEEFVRSLGNKYGIEVFVKRKSMENEAKTKKITLEEAGREIRYSFFDEVFEKVNGTKIALAHNLDDQIETFLFRLIRGSSLEGLEGIGEVRDKFIRPINEVYKSDIMKYLDSNNIPYMIDKTNLENDYTRNSIRLDLIPFIEERYNPRFKEKIKDFIAEVKEVNKIIEPNYDEYIIDNEIDVDKLLELESDYIKGKIINYYLNENKVSASRRKINNILSILRVGGTKKIKLDKDYTMIKEYAKISLVREKVLDKVLDEVLDEMKLSIPGEVVFGDYVISASKTKNEKEIDKEREEGILFYFVTNLKEGDVLTVRSRKAGDKILPIGMENYKKIKNIMIDSKIPKDKRETIPIITCEDEIVWIAGITKSKTFNSTSKDENIVLKMRRKNSA